MSAAAAVGAVRAPEASLVDPMFTARWSPRAFRDDPVPRMALDALFEAARWAPSSFNEQPWRFLYAATPADRARFLRPLSDGNRQWAKAAPVLVYVLAKKRFRRNGRPNRHALFDAGAAWMSLALQAQRLGLAAHAMGGFDAERARKVLGVPGDAYEIVAVVAVGYPGDAARLPGALRARERPSGRKPLAEVATEGVLNAVDGGEATDL